MISYKQMSLFDAPPGAIIIHACNSLGIWDAGIAKTFKENYPHSYLEYKKFCEEAIQTRRGTACGYADLSSGHAVEEHWVGWLITSHGYGSQKDPVELIKINTTLALMDLCITLYASYPRIPESNIDVYSNKFNSGLFEVPWLDSELILQTVLRDFKRINWIVCS